jgi:hypothetical protein
MGYTVGKENQVEVAYNPVADGMSELQALAKIEILTECGFRCLANDKPQAAFIWFMAAWNLRWKYCEGGET